MSWNWMTETQQEEYKVVCDLIDSIKTPEDFYRVMNEIDGFDGDVVRSARENKQCYNSAQYM